MLYVIPDTHFGHENIKRYCNRPDNFETLIQQNWNEIVTDDDTVIHLGDITFKDTWVREVGSWRGRKILVRGNHDKMPPNFYMECGFTIVVEQFVIEQDGVIMLFSHRPKFNHDCDINIHGHQHNLSVLDSTRLYLPLSIEHMGYKPLAIDENFTNALRKFLVQGKQPTLKEIMNVGQNAIGKPNNKDFYDGFGKEIFLQSKARLDECYKILGSPPYCKMRYGYRMWRYAIRYIEGKISKEEFITAIKNLSK